MAAHRYLVRLYEGRMFRGEKETNLDPASETALRSILEARVKERAGTLDLDLSRWSIVVHSLGGGRIHCRFRVTPDGLNLRTDI